MGISDLHFGSPPLLVLAATVHCKAVVQLLLITVAPIVRGGFCVLSLFFNATYRVPRLENLENQEKSSMHGKIMDFEKA